MPTADGGPMAAGRGLASARADGTSRGLAIAKKPSVGSFRSVQAVDKSPLAREDVGLQRSCSKDRLLPRSEWFGLYTLLGVSALRRRRQWLVAASTSVTARPATTMPLQAAAWQSAVPTRHTSTYCLTRPILLSGAVLPRTYSAARASDWVIPLHTALCLLPMLIRPCDEVGPSP